MAGIVFVLFNPSNYWTQYLCSEIIYLLSLFVKEGLLMVMKVFREAKSFVKYLFKVIIDSWDVYLPSRLSLLKSWCNSSEKGNRVKNITRRLSESVNYSV